MPVWPIKGIKQHAISIMLRDQRLYYAHTTSSDNVNYGECDWPAGFTDSPLQTVLDRASDIQLIVPPESVRIIHLDKPDGLKGKALYDFARIELLNYIDAPLNEIIPTLLNNPISGSHYITTQVVFSESIKNQIKQLYDHGISVNRISLPDGAFTPRNEPSQNTSQNIILALDPISPRLITQEHGYVTNIHPLPKPSMSPEQGLCPILSSSIEQWIGRYCANGKEPNMSIIGCSDEEIKRWINQLETKSPLSSGSYTSFFANNDDQPNCSNFATQWVRLARQHHKEKPYLAFDICWAKGKRQIKEWVLWPGYILLGLSLIGIIGHLVREHRALATLNKEIASLTTHNNTLKRSFSKQHQSLIGSYKPKLQKKNQTLLSGLKLLSSRHYSGVWVDTLTSEKNTVSIVGTATKLTALDNYSQWLKNVPLVKQFTLNSVTPKTKNKSLKRSDLDRIKGQIERIKRRLHLARGVDYSIKKREIEKLEKEKNKHLLQDDSDTSVPFNFTITLNLREN